MLASLSSPLPSGGFTFSISSSPFYSSLEAKQRTAAPPTLPSTIPCLSSASSTLRESRGLSQSLLVPKVTPLTTRLPDNVKVSTVPTQSASTPTTTSPLPTAQTTTTKTTSSLSFSAPAVISNVEKKAPIDAVLADFQASTELEKEKELIEEEKIPEEIQKFERCLQRELQLLEELKQYYLGTQGRGIDHSSVETQSAVKLGEELRAIMERKRLALSFLMPTLQESDNRSKEHFARVLDKLPQTCMDKVMSITSQPAEVAVANRYLLPVPEVAISPSFRGTENGTSLIVSVKLCYHGSEKEVSTTMQGKQEILQGIKQVNVDKNGRAAFGKLKVMEVSSKHRHQSFCLVFYLEEYSPQGSKRTLTHVKSTPFHVQSRPAKRKRDSNGESNGSAEEAEEPEEPSQKKKKKEAKKLFAEEQQQQLLQQQQPPITAGADRSSPVVGVQDCNYIDITDLLTLPQKEAARRLGISESMLCKRFKECTRRKWPYRYLRKIDKVINMLNLHKSDDGTVPKEDQEKLQRLNKEREECLRPVRIRITSYDRMSPMMRLRSRAADYDEEDIPIDALETLEMLKSGPSVNSPKSRECDDNDSGLKDEPMTEKSSSGDEGEMQVDDEEEEEEEGRDAVVACLANESSNNCCNSENNKDTNGLSASSSSLSISEEDEDMSESSSSSSDFELSEQAKEEGASSLFAFGRDRTGDREEEDKMVEASVPREPILPPSGPSAD